MADSIAAFGTLDTTWMMIYATCKSQAQLLPTPQDHSYGSMEQQVPLFMRTVAVMKILRSMACMCPWLDDSKHSHTAALLVDRGWETATPYG